MQDAERLHVALIIIAIFIGVRFLLALFFSRGIAKRTQLGNLGALIVFFLSWFFTEFAFFAWLVSFFVTSKPKEF